MLAVKIIGAGSVGNHIAHAARRLGWSVDLCDIDPQALVRTKQQIFPGRYGAWDESIRLFSAADSRVGGYDLIVIGTPPDTHVALATAALAESPRAVLVEKPFCPPDMDGAAEMLQTAMGRGVAVFTGYDHVVGRAAVKLVEVIQSGRLGKILTIDVEFREHWGGILAAHPWLHGPGDTYLGFWKRGGGASGEHSHATNFWQHCAFAANAGSVSTVHATADFVRDGLMDYDRLFAATLTTEKGLVGRVIQDVITSPPRKFARVQGTDGAVEWHCGFMPGLDVVTEFRAGERVEHRFEKTRPDDFIEELRHIEHALTSKPESSPIGGARGLETMSVVAAGLESARVGRSVIVHDWRDVESRRGNRES